jgi:hypothetical protein
MKTAAKLLLGEHNQIRVVVEAKSMSYLKITPEIMTLDA